MRIRDVTALVCSLALTVTAIAAKAQSDQQGKSTLTQAMDNPKARNIARKRFRFVRWYKAKTGAWPISEMIGDYQNTVLFPLGKSFIGLGDKYSLLSAKGQRI